MISVVPGATPVTITDPAPTVAMPGLALVQIPPVGVPLNKVVPPTQVIIVPVIVGLGFTVTLTVLKQPVPSM